MRHPVSNDHPAQTDLAEPPAAAEPGHRPENPDGAGAGASAGPPRPLRMVLIILGLLCMLVGPTSCYNSLEMSVAGSTNGQGNASNAALLLYLGVAASVGVPVVMATVAAFRRDLKAVGCSAALLAWPVVVTVAILLSAWTENH